MIQVTGMGCISPKMAENFPEQPPKFSTHIPNTANLLKITALRNNLLLKQKDLLSQSGIQQGEPVSEGESGPKASSAPEILSKKEAINFTLPLLYRYNLMKRKTRYFVRNGKIYDWRKMRSLPLIEAMRKKWAKEGRGSPSKMIIQQLHNPHNRPTKRKGWYLLTDEQVEEVMPSCHTGRLLPLSPREYWSDVRRDVMLLLKQFEKRGSSENQQPMLDQISRWISLYKLRDPQDTYHRGDRNKLPFLLPFGVTVDDIHASARESKPFDTRLECPILRRGEVVGYGAYSLVLEEEAEEKPKEETSSPPTKISEACMKKRRDKLASRFAKQYRYSQDKMAPFLSWATVMAEGHSKFITLCKK
ncbi:uncharacterized protein LOC124151473 [Haliotis rufescens]|uniref:uncharacterized protein LOC124151473 n=1 Tax=Haliotis rufescens TaxID=6454 RepID=UPI00201F18F9|nr:uncharacterized protein LOC124151473 [Haliotis rufescens]